jgi:glycosyltransferase involved in cell wall biosynthesis
MNKTDNYLDKHRSDTLLISVIIPVYNVEKYLEKCITSVIQQDYRNIEVILVDDGSPDKCPQICDSYSKKDSRVKVIHQTNSGLSLARNAGLRIALGDFIMFLDSDDWWNSEVSLRTIVSEVSNNIGTDIFVIGAMDYSPVKGYMKRYDSKNLEKFKNNPGIIEIYKTMINYGNLYEAAYTKIIRRSFIEKNNLIFQQGIISEDTEWFFRVLRCVKKIDIIDVDLIIYRSGREGSIVNTVSAKHVYDLLLIINQSLQYYHNTNNNDIYKNFELSHCSYLWFIVLSKYSLLSKTEKRKIKPFIQKVISVISFSNSWKTKLAYVFTKVFGIEITSHILSFYINLMNRFELNKHKVNHEK